MAPSAGGQVHWVNEFAPEGWGRILSFVEGWAGGVGWLAVVGVDCGVVADLIVGIAGVEGAWREVLVMVGVVVGAAGFDVFAAGHSRIAEGVFATCRIFTYVPIVVTLWVMVDPKAEAGEVFVSFRDFTGSWPSAGLSVCVGQMTGVFVSCRSDGLANLAEEVEDPVRS